MTVTDHYHDRIARATKRLAQLQARDLLAGQKRESKAREASKREQVNRRQRVADLVIMAGADGLGDAELVGALLAHLDARIESSVRQLVADRGALHIQQQEDSKRPQRMN